MATAINAELNLGALVGKKRSQVVSLLYGIHSIGKVPHKKPRFGHSGIVFFRIALHLIS
jgi:hypothetical protein